MNHIISLKDAKCEVCKPCQSLSGFMIGEDDQFYYTNEDGTLGWMYDIDCESRSLVCRHCGRFYMMCPKCSEDIISTDHNNDYKQSYLSEAKIVLCQFLGCYNLTFNSNSNSDNDDSNSDTDNTDYDSYTGQYWPSDPLELRKFRLISFKDKNVNFVKNEDIMAITGHKMTGPDGGQYLYWQCRKCSHLFYSCDK